MKKKLSLGELAGIPMKYSQFSIVERKQFYVYFKIVFAGLLLSIFIVGYCIPAWKEVATKNGLQKTLPLLGVSLLVLIVISLIIAWILQTIKLQKEKKQIVDCVVRHELDEDRPLLSKTLLEQGARLFEKDGYVLLKFKKESGCSFGNYFCPISKDTILSLQPVIILLLKENSFNKESFKERKESLLKLVDAKCTEEEISFSLENSHLLKIKEKSTYFFVEEKKIAEAMQN